MLLLIISYIIMAALLTFILGWVTDAEEKESDIIILTSLFWPVTLIYVIFRLPFKFIFKLGQIIQKFEKE